MAPHCTTGDWIRVAELSESALTPCIKTSFADSQEDAFYGDTFEFREVMGVDGEFNSSIKTLLPKVVFFNYGVDFPLVNYQLLAREIRCFC